jgi:hypothetical protein
LCIGRFSPRYFWPIGATTTTYVSNTCCEHSLWSASVLNP